MHILTNTLVIVTLSLAIGTAAGAADLFPRGLYWPQERVSWLAAEPAHRPMPTMIEDFSTPIVTGSLEDARVRMSTMGGDVGWHYELVQANQDNPPRPGTLTCSVSALTGDPSVHRPSGPIYVVYDGRANQGFESVILSFATDGENFTWGSVDEFNTPIPIPPGVSHLRFTTKNGGSLMAFYTVATEFPGD